MVKDQSYNYTAVIVAWNVIKAVDLLAVSPFSAVQWLP